MISRILSLIIIILYLVGAYLGGGGEAFLRMLGYMLLPFFCIWYGNEMGRAKGTFGPTGSRPVVNQISAGIFVVFLGWIFLLLPIIMNFLIQ